MPPLPPSPSLPSSPASVRPELLVLSSLPALHALKRPQLVMLCKEWGIKAVGKNRDIVDKLFAHGQLLASGELHDAGTDEDELEQDRMDVEMGIDDNMQVAVETEAEEMDDGGEANESSAVMVEYPDLDMQHEDLVQFGAVAHQVNFPQSISSSSIASTVRSTGTALRKRIDSIRSIISSVPASTSTAVADLVSQSDQQPQQTPVPAPPRAPMFVFGQSTATQSTATIAKSEFDFSVAVLNSEARELTAAEQVMQEMNERMMASRGAGGSKERESSTIGENGEGERREKEGPSPNKSLGRSFEGKHKRVFEQMDSISTHYAANRRPLAPLPSSASTSTFSFGISHSTSRRHLPTSTSTTALHHPQSESPAKRIKILPPIPRATLSPAKPRPLSSAPSTSALHRSSKLVSALREDGWSSAPPVASASGTGAPHVAFGSSVSTFRTKGVMREGLKPDSEEAERLKQSERDERKRKLELVKARRVSGAAAGAGRGRRRSLVVGPQKSSLLAKPRTFLKTVVQKLVPNHPPPSTNATATIAPIPTISRPIGKAPPFSTTLPNRFKPAPNASTNITGSTSTRNLSATAAPAGPSWKKFDLQKSLATPLGYTPKIVPKSTLLSASATSTSLSSAPSFSFGSLSVKSNTVLKPKRPLSRRPSARVANQGLLGKVGVSTTVAVTVEESDDRIGRVASGRWKVDALSGDAEGLVTAGSIFKSPAASSDAVGQSSRGGQPFGDVSNRVGATGSGSGAVKGAVGEDGEEVEGIRVV